ncbi:MAG: hypothetical protein EBU93_04415 [Chlamydiae bacterium]|nr:hypothetical protein [Chlamydiota bacterium]
MKNLIFLCIHLLFFITPNFESRCASTDTLWLITETFVKFGKKDAFEEAESKNMLNFKKSFSESGFWKAGNSSLSIFALEGLDEPQYIFLTPFKDFASVGNFFQKKESFEKKFSLKEVQESKALHSMINFSMQSLHSYLNECSRSSEGNTFLSEKTPFIHYWVIGITFGNEDVFEKHLKQFFLQNTGAYSINVWKVLLGADNPKYIIMTSATSKDALEKQISDLAFIKGSIKDIVRNQREGSAILKQKLCLFP